MMLLLSCPLDMLLDLSDLLQVLISHKPFDCNLLKLPAAYYFLLDANCWLCVNSCVTLLLLASPGKFAVMFKY